MLAAAPSAAQPVAPPAAAGTRAPAPGEAPLAKARAAWDKGDFDVAEPLYKDAILKGGLSPDDYVDAYAHLGAARAVLGKARPALEAFGQASIINANFEVPPEAGKKAKQLAEQARRATKRIGSITFSVQAPSTIKPGESFGVDATLDAAHLKIAKKVGVFVRDPLSGKTYDATTAPAASMHFDIPASITLPSATLVLRVDALDAHQNRLATSESKVHVEALPTPTVAEAPPPHAAEKARASKEREHEKPRSGGGFWSSAWPYVLGGVALAAGGAAAFIVTRPTDDVNLGGPRVQVR